MVLEKERHKLARFSTMEAVSESLSILDKGARLPEELTEKQTEDIRESIYGQLACTSPVATPCTFKAYSEIFQKAAEGPYPRLIDFDDPFGLISFEPISKAFEQCLSHKSCLPPNFALCL